MPAVFLGPECTHAKKTKRHRTDRNDVNWVEIRSKPQCWLTSSVGSFNELNLAAKGS